MKIKEKTAYCQRSVIADKLLIWYDACGRDLLWRKGTDLYPVWVSEIMLQQTRVEAVGAYYQRFLNRFPDMATLATAAEEEVLHVWQGLGYYSRARNLQAGVREVLVKYGGTLPQTRQEVEGLAGVGSYTAGALLSIVHGQPEPAVDGNVLRVFSRLFCVKQPVTSTAGKQVITQFVRQVIPTDRPGDFNQAIMDLGSSVCGKTPHCSACPLLEECAAYSQGCQAELPYRAKKPGPRPVPMAVIILRDQQQRYYVRKRPKGSLLADMWEFPTISANGTEDTVNEAALRSLCKETGQTVEALGPWRSLRHVFSHRAWELQIYRGTGMGPDQANHEHGCWMTLEQLDAVPLGKPHRMMADWLADQSLF